MSVEALEGAMNDRELASRASALVGPIGMPEAACVRDWRVAGALMQRCWSVDIYREGDRYDVEAWMRSGPGRARQYEAQHESLPRAIIEACVKALEGRR